VLIAQRKQCNTDTEIRRSVEMPNLIQTLQFRAVKFDRRASERVDNMDQRARPCRRVDLRARKLISGLMSKHIGLFFFLTINTTYIHNNK
jgi:hypothetical protein